MRESVPFELGFSRILFGNFPRSAVFVLITELTGRQTDAATENPCKQVLVPEAGRPTDLGNRLIGFDEQSLGGLDTYAPDLSRWGPTNETRKSLLQGSTRHSQFAHHVRHTYTLPSSVADQL